MGENRLINTESGLCLLISALRKLLFCNSAFDKMETFFSCMFYIMSLKCYEEIPITLQHETQVFIHGIRHSASVSLDLSD